MAKLVERNISGRGIVRIDKDSSDVKESRIISVSTSVLRYPTNRYINNNYNPTRSRYGTMNFMREKSVLLSVPIEFDNQVLDFPPESCYQNIYALICVYDGILRSFANLGTALGLTVIQEENRIKGFRHNDSLFDEIKIVCYADTAITVSVYSVPFDLCEDEQGNTTPTPPPAPEPPYPNEEPGGGRVPVGSPLTGDKAVSPAYDGEDDDGDTVPFPGDEPTPVEPPPEGGSCVQYLVVVSYTQVSTGQRQNNGGVRVYGEYIPQVRVSPVSPRYVEFYCRGVLFTGCQPEMGWYGVADAQTEAADPAIVSITPV